MLKTKQIAIIFNPKLSLYGCFGKKIKSVLFLVQHGVHRCFNEYIIMNLTKLQLS